MNLQSLIPSSVAHRSFVTRSLARKKSHGLRSWLGPVAAIAVVGLVAITAKDIIRYIRISTM
jgi:hypothetical protein